MERKAARVYQQALVDMVAITAETRIGPALLLLTGDTIRDHLRGEVWDLRPSETSGVVAEIVGAEIPKGLFN